MTLFSLSLFMCLLLVCVFKVRFLLNGMEVDELTHIAHAENIREVGRRICSKLRDTIPRQLYDVAIQAAIGGKVIARENVKALRKNVLAKCVSKDYLK